jgi:hypothetical protein
MSHPTTMNAPPVARPGKTWVRKDTHVEALQEFLDDFPYLGTFAVLLLGSLGGGPNI